MARTKAMCKRDIVGSPCMRSQDGQLQMKLADRLRLWKEYWEKLLNEENLWDNRQMRTRLESMPTSFFWLEIDNRACDVVNFGVTLTTNASILCLFIMNWRSNNYFFVFYYKSARQTIWNACWSNSCVQL